ncbi:MAG: hypothetical protein Q8O19_04475, partial [Rectinemataceae bacterium]|nr:hypothetical protein [Rectinemataceae bacterium]
NIPELVAPPVAAIPLPSQIQALAIDKSLPVVPGGNGIPKGEGRGYGTGQGNGIGSGKGLGNPEEITILRQTIPNYPLQPGDDFELLSKPVGVRLLVNAEGIPMEARAVSGPPKLYDIFTRSALEWRFHVPLSVRKNAPFRFTINFWPKLTKGQKAR